MSRQHRLGAGRRHKKPNGGKQSGPPEAETAMRNAKERTEATPRRK